MAGDPRLSENAATYLRHNALLSEVSSFLHSKFLPCCWQRWLSRRWATPAGVLQRGGTAGHVTLPLHTLCLLRPVIAEEKWGALGMWAPAGWRIRVMLAGKHYACMSLVSTLKSQPRGRDPPPGACGSQRCLSRAVNVTWFRPRSTWLSLVTGKNSIEYQERVFPSIWLWGAGLHWAY